jgi:hypothetical protein
MPAGKLKTWLIRVFLIFWGLQVVWLARHFSPEWRNLAWRVAHQQTGSAFRQQDQLYRWLAALDVLLPPAAAYVFLDLYESDREVQGRWHINLFSPGLPLSKYICSTEYQVRYHLAPRSQVLLSPDVPASFLFQVLRQEEAPFLVIRGAESGLGPGARAAAASPTFLPVSLPGPGLVFRVEPSLLKGGVYD